MYNPSDPRPVRRAPVLPGPERLEAIAGALSRLRRRSEVSGAWLDYRLAVLEAQHRALAALVLHAPPPAAPPKDAAVSVEDLAFDEGWLLDLSAALVKAAQACGQPSEALVGLQAAIGARPALGRELVQAVLLQDHDALAARTEALGLPVGALALHGRMLAAPVVLRAVVAATRAQPIEVGVGQPRCPFCGDGAAMATLDREGGARALHCGLCGGSWSYRRIACCACGQDDQRQLGTLIIGDDDPAWIETCSACGAGVKTFDLRRINVGFDALAEGIASLHLDLLAAREGVMMPLPSVALG